MKTKTLRQIIKEQLDPTTAAALEPIIKKYADRAVQDKLPEAQLLNQLVQELSAMKNTKLVQQPQAVNTVQNTGV